MERPQIPPLEMGLITLAGVFHKYADGTGKDATLKKEAFKKLVQEQLPHVAVSHRFNSFAKVYTLCSRVCNASLRHLFVVIGSGTSTAYSK